MKKQRITLSWIKWIWICCITFLCVACTNDYSIDHRPGKQEFISLMDVDEKLQKKESFLLVFTQDYCSFCMEYHTFVTEYLKQHHITIYEVNLSKQEQTMKKQDILNYLSSKFPQFSTTPGIFFIENGVVKDKFVPSINQITEREFDKFVKKYQLDRKQDQ